MLNKKITLLSKIVLAGSFALFSINSHAALTCPAGTQSALDWDVVDWTDPTNAGGGAAYNPTLAESYTIGGVDFDFVITSDIPNLNASLENISGTLASPNDVAATVGPGDTDGDGFDDAGLGVVVNPLSAFGGVAVDLDVILDITISEPLSEFEFSLSDIDQAAGRRDQVTIIGFYMGATVLPTLSDSAATPTYVIASNVATATATAGNRTPALNPEEATVIATFDQPIDALRIIYSDADETTLAGGRGITMMNDFAFCPAPDISGTVFTDADGNSNFSAGDDSVSGSTIQLFADDGAGNPTGLVLATTTSDASGDYSFVDIGPGDYVVVETDQAEYVSVTDSVGANDNIIPVTLTTNDVIDRNFLDIFSADVVIDKDDSELTYTPGDTFSYTLLVTNAGLANANGSVVADTLPAWATNVTWTCGSTTGGAFCPNANGTGNLNETIVTLPSGGTLTYTVSGTYSSDMTDYP